MTLPADVVTELRELAPPEGLSGFVAEAIRERLERVRLEDALAAGFGAWQADDDPQLATPEAVSKHVHNRRRLDDAARERSIER